MGRLIAFDWGTTNVRAALLSANGDLIEERRGESGVGSYSADQFVERFNELIHGWPVVPVIAAGMVGSRQGWHEAAYLSCPTSVNGLSGQLTRFTHGDYSIAIVPGFKMDGIAHHDVMRGEETQIAGRLADSPTFTGTLVLPGTHSKWVRLKDGMIEQFTTYMTGELFSALSQHTILRHSVGDDENSKNSAFEDGVRAVFTEAGSHMARLFDLRAKTLIKGTDAATLREELSGLLIGMEMSAAAQDGYDVQAFEIIGTESLIERYERAAHVVGADVTSHRGTELIWPALWNIAQKTGLIE